MMACRIRVVAFAAVLMSVGPFGPSSRFYAQPSVDEVRALAEQGDAEAHAHEARDQRPGAGASTDARHDLERSVQRFLGSRVEARFVPPCYACDPSGRSPITVIRTNSDRRAGSSRGADSSASSSRRTPAAYPSSEIAKSWDVR